LDPEADGARDHAVDLGHEDERVLVLQMGEEDLPLGPGIVGDGGPCEPFHEREHRARVSRLGRPDRHGIDR
jgi:hypothetical protein